MLKSKQLLYIYALLVPYVAASYFCQFKPECDGKYYSGTHSRSDDYDYSFGLPGSSSGNNFTESPKNYSTSTEPVITNQRGLSDSCCQDCICGRNCIRTSESCCFPELTHTTVNVSVETCTYAQSPLPYVENRYKVFAYYMVDRNPPDGCLDKDFPAQHPEKQCGEIDAAYWGSLHPVSSISTGKIYRNIHCAACHGVTDAKLWQAMGTYRGLRTYLTEENKFGNIHFINIDGKFNDIDRRCFHGRIINNCPSSDFFIPETLDMDAETVASACLNETFSPYIHEHVYSNVFCLICNNDLRNHTIIQRLNCRRDSDIVLPFTAILIPLYTTVYQKERQQLACLKMQYPQIMPKCRSVLCQSVTILIDEECQHVTAIVTSIVFMVNIVLIPTSSVTFFQLQIERIEELTNHLIQTWGDYWQVHNVAVSFDYSFEVDTILVTLIYFKGRVSMPAFLDQIKTNLNKSSHWIHNSGNESQVYLKPSNSIGSKAISRQTIDVILETVNDIYDDDGSIKDALNLSKTYETVFSDPYNNTIISSRATTISEMFYCKQIELHHNEFVMVSQDIVYIKHLDRLLYEGQFIEVPDRDGHGPKLRICLYESGFSLDISSSGEMIKIVISKILAILVFNAFVCLYSL